MFYGADNLIVEKATALRSYLTTAEETLWNHLKGGQLGVEFLLQHPAYLYVLDFYCHELKLVIELDGGDRQADKLKRNDAQRQEHLKRLGLSVLRCSNGEVLSDTSGVIQKIKKSIAERKQVLKSGASAKTGEFSIIPAIDIIDGKCVRLTQGNYSETKIYNERPLEVARQFEDAGLVRLHLVDLDGARTGAVKNWKVLESIAGKTSLVIDFGGGVKTEEDLSIIFGSGATFATVGSIAVKEESVFAGWLLKYGPAKFLLGADVKDEKIAVSGWAETTDIWIYDFLENYLEKGVKQVFCTDVSRDGLLQGPSTSLYKNIVEKFPPLQFIASGGVSSMSDLDDLRNIGCKGVIIGKAIYEGKLSLEELTKFNQP